MLATQSLEFMLQAVKFKNKNYLVSVRKRSYYGLKFVATNTNGDEEEQEVGISSKILCLLDVI